jgi:putative phage-type endonuclease
MKKILSFLLITLIFSNFAYSELQVNQNSYLSATLKSSIESACIEEYYNGPLKYVQCFNAQLELLGGQKLPNISHLESVLQESLKSSCIGDYYNGPSKYVQCFNAQLELLGGQKLPNISHLESVLQESLKSSCIGDYYNGPSKYVQCFNSSLGIKQLNNKNNFLEKIKMSYINNIAIEIRDNWHFFGAEDEWFCNVYVQQNNNGIVQDVNIQNCNMEESDKSNAFKRSIERAVYKSSPLPLSPDKEVFDTEILIKFGANDGTYKISTQNNKLQDNSKTDPKDQKIKSLEKELTKLKNDSIDSSRKDQKIKSLEKELTKLQNELEDKIRDQQTILKSEAFFLEINSQISEIENKRRAEETKADEVTKLLKDLNDRKLIFETVIQKFEKEVTDVTKQKFVEKEELKVINNQISTARKKLATFENQINLYDSLQRKNNIVNGLIIIILFLFAILLITIKTRTKQYIQTNQVDSETHDETIIFEEEEVKEDVEEEDVEEEVIEDESEIDKNKKEIQSTVDGFYLPFEILDITKWTKEWVDLYSLKIDSIDAPIIMGVNSSVSSSELLNQKTNKQYDFSNYETYQAPLELKALKSYKAKTGISVKPLCLQSKEFSWQIASTSCISKDYMHAVEIIYGEFDYTQAKNNVVPDYYYPRLQHLMMVTGLDKIHLWCYCPGKKGILQIVERNQIYIDSLLRFEQKFNDNLVNIG